MPERFGMQFYRERLDLRSGGVFDFDAVSADKSITATISTSGASTAAGKNATGKILKLRSDMLFLLLAKAQKRVIVLTEKDMYDRCLKERDGGRVPPEIEFAHAPIPADLEKKLIVARAAASKEVSP
jgi:hypothetical protein